MEFLERYSEPPWLLSTGEYSRLCTSKEAAMAFLSEREGRGAAISMDTPDGKSRYVGGLIDKSRVREFANGIIGPAIVIEGPAKAAAIWRWAEPIDKAAAVRAFAAFAEHYGIEPFSPDGWLPMPEVSGYADPLFQPDRVTLDELSAAAQGIFLPALAKPFPSPFEQNTAKANATSTRAAALKDALAAYGIQADVVSISAGPVITQFEIDPTRGTKIAAIKALEQDIARAMEAPSCRIASSAGRKTIGVELPNARREDVLLREMLASHAFRNSAAGLPLALGKSTTGEHVIIDLAAAPHLLMAGTTGSGKSVSLNTMILSLLSRHTPDTCTFVMIDPKMLELSGYDGIPHLLSPVVTDPKKAVSVLQWLVEEMMRRYERIRDARARDFTTYNAKHPTDPLAYIVVIIDEMADLMMTAGKAVEIAVQRLSQMARAAGIHMIIATQRPSTDVLTGPIKTNLPTRISFRMATGIDSRVILDELGAEQLLGKGDMLYSASGAPLMRVHGSYVSNDEIEEAIKSVNAKGGAACLMDDVTLSDGDIIDLTPTFTKVTAENVTQQAAAKPDAKTRAMAWVLEALKDGQKTAVQMRNAARLKQISYDTLGLARQELEVLGEIEIDLSARPAIWRIPSSSPSSSAQE